MKQGKFKASVIFLAMLVVVVMVSACSGNSGKTNDTNKSTDKPAATDAPKQTDEGKTELPEYTISLVYPGTPQTDEALVEEAMNKILKEKINAKIDLMPIDWGAWDDKVNLLIASQDQDVDIMFTAQWTGFAKNVAKKAFLELNDLLDEHGQGVIETLGPEFIKGSQINGINYGIPTNKELAAAGGIVYRKDVADELGIDMSKVKTIEDLDAVYAVVKEKRPDLVPLYISSTDNTFNAHFFGNYDFLGDSTIPGAIFKDGDETKVFAIEDTDRFKQTTKATRDLFLKGYINADAATSQVSAQDAWKAGIVFSSVESLKPGKAEEVASGAGLSGKLEQIQMTEKTISASETTGSMLAISTTSQDPARAMMLINLLHTDKELNNLINFGIEGTHYTRNGEIMTPTDKTTNYSPGAAWMFGNQFLNYLWETEDPDKWAKFKEFNSTGKVSLGLGFVFNSEPVKNEVGALANVIKQYQVAIDRGAVDVDKVLPEYTKKLKEAGLDKVIAEKQKQFDEFLANK